MFLLNALEHYEENSLMMMMTTHANAPKYKMTINAKYSFVMRVSIMSMLRIPTPG